MSVNSIFLDTNFLLDALVEGRPQSAEAFDVFCAIADGEVAGLVMPSQLVDFCYIARKGGMSDKKRRESVGLILDCCSVCAVDQSLLLNALQSDEPDFEDGLIRQAAEEFGADFIATRDEKGFTGSTVPKAEPRELVQHLGL